MNFKKAFDTDFMKRRFLLQKIDSYAKAINVEIACAGLARRSYATGRQIASFFALETSSSLKNVSLPFGKPIVSTWRLFCVVWSCAWWVRRRRRVRVRNWQLRNCGCVKKCSVVGKWSISWMI